MYFECHITLKPPGSKSKRERYNKLAKEVGWKTSEIRRDPVLGNKTYFYLTKYFKVNPCRHHEHFSILEVEDVVAKMAETAARFKTNVVRQKVELVVFDTKGKDNG